MGKSVRTRRLGALVLVVGIAAPAYGAGFSIFEQGTRAMGMGMAFTAQADDPSAMFYNVGGLAFMEQRDFYAGVTLVSLGDSDFQGELPFPGPTETGTQVDQFVVPPHFYWVEPINEKLTFGLGLESPYGLVTEWENPSQWSGRYISYKAELKALDLNPNLAIRVNEKLGVGVGLVIRTSMIDLRRRAGLINPFSGLLVDVADVQLESDFDTGVGFNLGVLQEVNDLFQWGFSYRSKLTIEYGGTGRLEQILTGNAALDGQVAATLPLGQDLPIATQIQFPDSASVGLGFNISDRSFFEIDFNWTGWSSFDAVPLTFIDNPTLSTTIDTKWEDAIHVRTGLRWKQGDKSEWRFGLYYDETPQPDESVGPLLPDANRIGYTVGWGHEYNKFNMDLALLLVDFDDRTTLTNDDGFNGSYKTDISLFGVSFGF